MLKQIKKSSKMLLSWSSECLWVMVMGYGPVHLWVIISNLAKVNGNQKLLVSYGLVTSVKWAESLLCLLIGH